MRVLLAVLLTAACAHSREWRPPNAEQTVFFAIGESLIVLDILQSLDIKNHPGGYEMNPLLGRHPSDLEFLLVGGAALSCNAFGWYELPHPWREVLGTVVFVVEDVNVAHNFGVGLRLRLP